MPPVQDHSVQGLPGSRSTTTEEDNSSQPHITAMTPTESPSSSSSSSCSSGTKHSKGSVSKSRREPPAADLPVIKSTPAHSSVDPEERDPKTSVATGTSSASTSSSLAIGEVRIDGVSSDSEVSGDRLTARSRRGSRKLSFDPVSLSILVVDDDPVARRIIQHCLEEAGYRHITCCATATEALEQLFNTAGSMFHLSLIDVHMPDVNGFDLLRRIRTDTRLGMMPVIMMSAADELEVVYHCLQDGADDYILKPIRKEAIQNLWSNVWRKRRDHRQLSSMASEQSELSVRLGKMTDQLQQLRCQVDEAVETPINVITRTITDMVKNGNLTPEVRHTLSSIVKSLGASNLYQPAFRRFLAPSSPSSTPRIDDQTRRWLQAELSITSSPHTSAAVGISHAAPAASTHEIPKLRSWDFPVHEHTLNELCSCVPHLLRDFGLIDRFRIDCDKLDNFVVAVRHSYQANPYHNFRHAWDVMQCTYLMLSLGRAAEFLTPIEILSLLLASLCHDLDHPGFNNVFQVSTRSPLALRYNDLSVLENHHCAEAYRILSQPECDILENLSADEAKETRRLFISVILGTDLARYHMEIYTKFKSVISTFSAEDASHRELLMQVILKSADISNPARPFPIAAYWSRKVMREFFEQGDAERELGLVISPTMDRHTVKSANTQANFIHFVVEPLFSAVCEFLPELAATCKPCDHLRDNKTRWQQFLETEERGQPSPASPDYPLHQASPQLERAAPSTSD